MAVQSLAEKLGLAPDARIVVPHQDDVGMCHGANAAFATLAGQGFITSGSVMVPCPWFLELAALAAERPALDIGVHLTLTSEWQHYRWRPLTGAEKASGLVDDEGYMWRQARAVAEHAHADAVEAELRAQIDAALAAGIDVTHLDHHMGTALAPEFVEITLRLARDYGLPVLFPRHWDGFGGPAALRLGDLSVDDHATRVAVLEAAGQPIIDRFIESHWEAAPDKAPHYRAIIESAEPGVTFLAFHCNAPGDIEVIDPPRAHTRTDELALFQDTAFLGWVAAQGLDLVGFRAIREACR